MKSEKFIFEISVSAIPYNRETTEEIYGKGGYNEDIGVQSHAADIVFTALNDYVGYCIHQELEHLSKCGCDSKDMDEADARYYRYLKAKTKHAEEIRDSLKYIRNESI